MTVKQLIEELQKLPFQEAEVTIPDLYGSATAPVKEIHKSIEQMKPVQEVKMYFLSPE